MAMARLENLVAVEKSWREDTVFPTGGGVSRPHLAAGGNVLLLLIAARGICNEETAQIFGCGDQTVISNARAIAAANAA